MKIEDCELEMMVKSIPPDKYTYEIVNVVGGKLIVKAVENKDVIKWEQDSAKYERI